MVALLDTRHVLFLCVFAVLCVTMVFLSWYAMKEAWKQSAEHVWAWSWGSGGPHREPWKDAGIAWWLTNPFHLHRLGWRVLVERKPKRWTDRLYVGAVVLYDVCWPVLIFLIRL